GDPTRFGHASEIVTHAAPGLQRVLAEALAEGGWFGSAHEGQLTSAALTEDPEERLRAVRTLVAEALLRVLREGGGRQLALVGRAEPAAFGERLGQHPLEAGRGVGDDLGGMAEARGVA